MAVHGCPRSNLESTLRCPHGRILALPPADREPSRFAAHGQAQKHLVFAVRPSGPTCCGRGPSAVRGQDRDVPVPRPNANSCFLFTRRLLESASSVLEYWNLKTLWLKTKLLLNKSKHRR